MGCGLGFGVGHVWGSQTLDFGLDLDWVKSEISGSKTCLLTACCLLAFLYIFYGEGFDHHHSPHTFSPWPKIVHHSLIV